MKVKICLLQQLLHTSCVTSFLLYNRSTHDCLCKVLLGSQNHCLDCDTSKILQVKTETTKRTPLAQKMLNLITLNDHKFIMIFILFR